MLAKAPNQAQHPTTSSCADVEAFLGQVGALGPTPKTGDGLEPQGHTAISIKPKKRSEDDKFVYHFTFIETNREKGFVTLHRPTSRLERSKSTSRLDHPDRTVASSNAIGSD